MPNQSSGSIRTAKPNFNLYLASVAVAITILVVLLALVYLQRSRPGAVQEAAQGKTVPVIKPAPTGFLRAGSPDFEHYRQFISVEGIEATQTSRVLGDIVMELTATAKNSSDRTLTQLELRGVVFNESRETVGERTVGVIPKQQGSLKPNETTKVRILIEGIPLMAHRKGIRMEVTGYQFE